MKWLVDTNVLSELRKKARCDSNVARWAESVSEESMFTSVLVIGEIRRGIGLVARKDAAQARALSKWLDQIRVAFAGRTLEITEQIAEEWGRLGVPERRPAVDALLAATAKVHGLTVATRNTIDFGLMGVEVHNPFQR
ncbi:MAG: type II toxin-antitoxin system VapC family toxin [Archangium sp.]|nr:type II toxin-antitoxin system VapC family toxin [Archangium sp.]